MQANTVPGKLRCLSRFSMVYRLYGHYTLILCFSHYTLILCFSMVHRHYTLILCSAGVPAGCPGKWRCRVQPGTRRGEWVRSYAMIRPDNRATCTPACRLHCTHSVCTHPPP
jgi:hypothetical protein